jgi:hypothetical protein
MSKLTDFFPSSTGKGNQNAILIMVGGGGGAATESGIGANNTAGGDVLCTFLNISTGISCPIIVGAGGAAGCTAAPCQGQPGGAGSPGGDSSFGDLIARGGGGAGSRLITCGPCVSPTPYSTGYQCRTCTTAPGGVGAIYGITNRIVKALPPSYPGYSGTIAFRYAGGNTCCPVQAAPQYSGYCTLIPRPIPVKDCFASSVPITTCFPAYTPLAPPTCNSLTISCRVVCSAFFNVELSGQPYSGNFVTSGTNNIPVFPLSTCNNFNRNCLCFDISKNSLGCSRYGGDYLPCSGPGPAPIPYFTLQCACASIPNNPNTGHSGRCAGCNGDSGVVVLFYPTSIPAASSFPGGIDCTPVSSPFGMRAYKFTSSGSITI